MQPRFRILASILVHAGPRVFWTVAIGYAFAILFPQLVLANGHITETTYSADAFIRLLIAGIGGVLAVLGVALAFKNSGIISSVSLSTSGAEFRKISQGVVIALLGVIVLIAGLYLLPDKTKVTDTTGKTITETPDGRRAVGN